jgi:hypothetical protein
MHQFSVLLVIHNNKYFKEVIVFLSEILRVSLAKTNLV